MTGQAQTLLQTLQQDRSLREPQQLRRRIEALDALEVHFPDEADAARTGPGRRAAGLRLELEAINHQLYEAIRGEIRGGGGPEALLRWLPPTHDAKGAGYDHLDELVSGVLRFEPPGPVAAPAAEMVFYQPTPARHIFDLLRRAAPAKRDLLVDLGSGLGHVPLLAAICTPARALGIELEGAYVGCARRCAASLNLSRVAFTEQDAREANLSAGTLFYLYTPFSGGILRTVLDRLRREAARRAIRVCTFGPCAAVVAAEPWLRNAGPPGGDCVAIFSSRGSPGASD